jgi:cation:H+ antiporter
MSGLLWVVVGFILLVVGAEGLVRGASRLAIRFGVSPLVIGLTVVAFGTSSPEVAVSLSAVLGDRDDLSIGNAVGSNTFNVLFILGASALITPLAVAQKLVRVDVPLMIGASILIWLLARDGSLGRTEGALLFLGLIGYTVSAIVLARRESVAVQAEYAEAVATASPPRLGPSAVLILVGLALCVLGANLLVAGASSVARALGVSELIIGLTIVAAGTSLPEAATSIVAALRGQRDIAVGNIVGSNIFNMLGILGLAGLLAPDGVAVSPAALAFDIPVMTAVALACLPVCFSGRRISRMEGAIFLALYLAYVLFLALNASSHDALQSFESVMLWFALPIAAMWVSIDALRQMIHPRSTPP